MGKLFDAMGFRGLVDNDSRGVANIVEQGCQVSGQSQGLRCGWWELQTARGSVVCRNSEPTTQFQPCGSSLELRRGCGFEVASKFVKFV